MIRGVYLVLDPHAVGGRDPVRVAEAAIRGGISVLQWRQKNGSITARWESLLAIGELCRNHGIPFLVNDRIDVALATGADGVHVGQDDLPFQEVRRLIPDHILGLSVTGVEHIDAAAQLRPSYLGAGPVFPTQSKADAAPVTGLGLIRACAATGLPVVGIGGITVENASSVIDAGAHAVAVISAICGASDPEHAARELVSAIAAHAGSAR